MPTHQTKSLIIDPALFRETVITPQTMTAVKQVEELLSTVPPIYDVGAQPIREARARGEGLLGSTMRSENASWIDAYSLLIPGGSSVPVRIFKSSGKTRGVYLHIHGGGHTIGAADLQDEALELLSNKLQIAVVSVEYRLAPENPFPAGPDDCEMAACWLIEQSEKLFGTKYIIIGGESAGAHLAALTLLRMRDRHNYVDFSGANLLYGIYDLSLTPSARHWGERNLIINTPIINWFIDNFVPRNKFNLSFRQTADISPLYASLHNMPPALFTVGTLDPIIDDSLFMAQRWAITGNKTELAIYPGGIHAFDLLPIDIAAQAQTRIENFIDQCLHT